MGAVLSVVAYVNAPVKTLIATSGVFAIILGLALQSTLSDDFSGMALNLGKPYTIGDRIVLGDGIEGRTKGRFRRSRPLSKRASGWRAVEVFQTRAWALSH